MDIDLLRAGIPAVQRCTYLNCGTYGPLPTVVADELVRWYRRIEAEGTFAFEVTRELYELYDAARQRVARLLNAPPASIALTRNVSDGANIVASGLTWQPGDEVIITNEEHSSGAIPWFNLARRAGITVRVLQLTHDSELILQRLDELITRRTRLIYVSHISCISGLRLPVQEICQLAHDRGVLVMLDGAHAVGQIPVDVTALGCDFYAGCGHKWLCGPQGTGFLYVHPERLPELEPTFVGWGSSQRYNLDELLFVPWDDGRRFEFGTRPWPLYAGLKIAVERIMDLDVSAIEQQIMALTMPFKERLATIPELTLHSPLAPDLSSGLIAFSHEGPADLGERLWREHRILLAHNPERRWVRIAINAYVLPEELDRLLELLQEYVARR